MTKKRVALVGIFHESNSFAEGVTGLDMFQLHTLQRGAEVWAQRGRQSAAGAYISVLEEAGFEAVPIVLAYASPGPVVTDEALRQLWAMAAAELRCCGALDAVLFTAHGAGVSEVERDMDGWWLSQLREAVGPDVPVMGLIDPHANVSRKMLAAVDVLLPFKRNPHTDVYERAIVVAKMLVGKLRGEINPVQAYCLTPMVMNIEKQHTESEPLAALVRSCDEVEKEAGILDASVLMGFHYADVEEMTSSVQVVADGDCELAKKTALKIGGMLWDNAEAFLPQIIEPDDALDRAIAAPKPVCLLDMGDNVGGGGSARGTWLLDALSRRQGLRSFFMMQDVAAVEAAHAAGAGSGVELVLGGADRAGRDGPDVTFSGRVEAFPGESFDDPTPRHGGTGTYRIGRSAVLRSDDGNRVVLVTTLRASLRSRLIFEHCGLRLEDFDVVVAKGVNAPLAAFDGRCPTFIRVNTSGATAVDLDTFEFHCRRQPLFPFERGFTPEWEALTVVAGRNGPL